MRTTIVIDDELMKATLKATGIRTKREAVEQGLRALLRSSRQVELRKLRGKYEWEGGLDAIRRDSRQPGTAVRTASPHPATARSAR